jgi:hypothetical protein
VPGFAFLGRRFAGARFNPDFALALAMRDSR